MLFKKNNPVEIDYASIKQTLASENFMMSEMFVSKQFPKIAKEMKPSMEILLQARLTLLVCAQPIRTKFGKTGILSGIRLSKLNKKVGGVSDSDHLDGLAIDVSCNHSTAKEVYDWIVNESKIPYRQVILYEKKNFVHISMNNFTKEQKHEAL